MNFLILTQKYNFNPICFIMDDSNIKCRGSQAVRRLSRKQLRESVQGFESLSRRISFDIMPCKVNLLNNLANL